ncbi:unnamed protein product [Arctogadus glacialis]
MINSRLTSRQCTGFFGCLESGDWSGRSVCSSQWSTIQSDTLIPPSCLSNQSAQTPAAHFTVAEDTPQRTGQGARVWRGDYAQGTCFPSGGAATCLCLDNGCREQALSSAVADRWDVDVGHVRGINAAETKEKPAEELMPTAVWAPV